jgi:hypothetical protein
MARQPTVTVVKDNRKQVMEAIRELSRTRVMVGIPDSNAGRNDGAISNAALGYIHEHGAPERNLPARPFLRPGVASAQLRVITGLRRAGTMALTGNLIGMRSQLEAVGLLATSAVRRKITEGPFVPLAERTVIGRLRRTQRGRRTLTRLRGRGVDLAAWGATNLRPLIDTGQLRQAITYVIRRVR